MNRGAAENTNRCCGEKRGGVFQRSEAQGSLFQTSNLLPEDKRARLERGWAGQFARHALPLIDEEQFRDLYCADNGRPNKPVRMVVGTLVLKEMFDQTDDDALYRVDYDLGWQVALGLTPEDAHCCQKTLHNFRAKLLENEKAKQLFADMTDRMLKQLGLSAERQRLDSTHIVSNIARLTRLGLFCETIRVFLRELQRRAPRQFQSVPEALRQRYLDAEGGASRYHDAKQAETRRRLKVCARDMFRLAYRFEEDPQVLKLESYGVLLRLFEDQCEVAAANSAPEPDDADAQEAPVPVVLKESKEVESSSLQTPHDVDVTYSGHKGKGYEVQIAETVGNGEKPELLTYVEMTPACKSDEAATVPAVAALAARELQPKELLADTNYGSTENALACAARGTELVTPVRGPAEATAAQPAACVADFTVDAPGEQAVRCPAGHAPESAERSANGSMQATYSKLHCAQCPLKRNCAARRNANGTRTLKTTLREYTLAKRRRYEQTEEFRKRYAERAGIEATNSELKRGHGLGRLRVRGGARVKLAVYFKALACNVKRLVRYWAALAAQLAKLAENVAGAAHFGACPTPCASWRAVWGVLRRGNFAPAPCRAA